MIRELFSTGFAITLTLGIVHADEGPATPVAGVTSPELVDRCSPGSVPCSQASPRPTWHGLQLPTQPFSPPGAFPVAPNAPGYYTLRQLVQGDPAEKPPRRPYARSGIVMPSYAEFNFAYLDPIPFSERDWAERLAHPWASTGSSAPVANSVTATTMSRTARLTGKHTNYNLYRTRASGDLWYEDVVRLYGEFLFGDITGHELPPLPRDVNRGDILNLFTDVKLAEPNGNPLYLRFGQQELLFGSQRLLSTNDWGNNRHRFQAVKTFYRSKQWDADLFTGRPVQVRFNDLDPGDHDQWFTGAWLTYKPAGTFFDLYYLNLDNTTPGVATGRLPPASSTSTLSAAAAPPRLRLPVGRRGRCPVRRLGRPEHPGRDVHDLHRLELQERALNPTVWVGYDFASGDPDRTRPARDGPSINSLRSVTTISGSWTTWDDRTSTTSPCRRTAIR